MTAQAASHVYFGLNPMWVSTCVLAITYATIMSEKVNRSIVALVGAGVMILIGVLDQDEAIKGIDWNTIGLLTGMMILVSISRRSGMFQYLAIWSAKAAKAHPAGILFILQITTAVLSAFLDNVTTVLLIVPVTLAICTTLKVPAYPYLFAEIFASNIGGTATLIGDPPNILIGSQVGLTFNDFVFHLTPVIIVVMVVQAVFIHFIWGTDLQGIARRRSQSNGDECGRFDPRRDAAQTIAVILTLVMIAFVLARPLHLEPATIAMLGAAVLMLLDNWAHHTRESRAQYSSDLWRRGVDHHLLLHRPFRRGAWRRRRRPASICLPTSSSPQPVAIWRMPAMPSSGHRRCCRRSSTTFHSSPP